MEQSASMAASAAGAGAPPDASAAGADTAPGRVPQPAPVEKVEFRKVLPQDLEDQVTDKYSGFETYGEAMVKFFEDTREEGYLLVWQAFREVAKLIGTHYPDESLGPNDQKGLAALRDDVYTAVLPGWRKAQNLYLYGERAGPARVQIPGQSSLAVPGPRRSSDNPLGLNDVK